MGYESCGQTFGEFFTDKIKAEMGRQNLPVPFIMFLLEESCQDRTCSHHLFHNSEYVESEFAKQCANCKCLFEFVEEYDMTFQGIADVLGISKQWVNESGKCGMDKLRIALGDKGGDGSDQNM